MLGKLMLEEASQKAFADRSVGNLSLRKSFQMSHNVMQIQPAKGFALRKHELMRKTPRKLDMLLNLRVPVFIALTGNLHVAYSGFHMANSIVSPLLSPFVPRIWVSGATFHSSFLAGTFG